MLGDIVTAAGKELPNFLSGGGVMAARIASYDWSRSPIGEIAGWPQSLRTALSIILNSKFPKYMTWGSQYIGFYNDAYIPLLGKKEALGLPFNETWAEAWHIVGPIAQRAMAGEASYFENLPIVIERHGYPEQTYYTFSYSPIRDESGDVGGVQCTVVETTATVVAVRQQQFQLELWEGLRGLDAPDEITGFACQLLGKYMNAVRVGYANVIEATNTIDVKQGWHDGTVVTVVGQKLPLNSFGPQIVDELRQGRTVRLRDVATDPRSEEGARAYLALNMRSALIVPITRGGELISIVSVGVKEPRIWNDEEVALAEDTAERTRSAVERAIAEQALKDKLAQERDRLQMLFHQAPSFVAVLKGPEHVFELVNAAYMRLIGNRHVIGLPARQALPDAEGQGFFEKLDEVYATGKAFSALEAPLAIRQEAGHPLVTRYLDFIYQPVIEPNGSVSGIFVEGSDVTERKLASDALREADRRKDEFLAMLAHELRNPLAPVSTAAQLLKLAADDADRVRQVSDIISRQVKHMSELVDDLLDVSRVTRGLVELQKEYLDVKAVVYGAIEQVQPLIEARRHTLTTKMDAEHLPVHGDRTRLIQILVNLLNNAAKYTPQGGEIALTVTARDGSVSIAVADNGAGIAPDLLPRVFELFVQGERTPDRSQGGLGIGLALVKSIVGLHGGFVEACSAGAGQGSVFTVTLPLQADARACARDDAAISLSKTLKPLRIMIVDDNADAARTLAVLLELEGHRIQLHEDGRRALAAAQQNIPDVFVLDIGLPDMTGYELASKLRAQPALSRATFIALTGYGQARDRLSSKSAGFHHHLIKPVDIRQLSAILAGVEPGDG